jgi:hypothetical protein
MMPFATLDCDYDYGVMRRTEITGNNLSVVLRSRKYQVVRRCLFDPRVQGGHVQNFAAEGAECYIR